jgi:hypothetical protein
MIRCPARKPGGIVSPLRRALRIVVASLGSEHPDSQAIRANTIALLQATGRSEDAIARHLADATGQ